MADYNIHVFEKHAHEYDRWFETHTYAYESEVLAIRSFLPRDGKGLEVGVGTGRFASRVGIKVGVEPAHAMASIARQRGVEVCEARAEALPFGDASFDFVVIVTSLCFLEDPMQALREAKRVIMPGGSIIIGMIDRETPLGGAYERRKQESTFYRNAHFHSVTQVIAWLRTVGFSAIRTCQTLFPFPEEMIAVDTVAEGHGQGGFVVITAQKEGKT
jgi:ubiquinone/menaquinone biosynthesis C-methylase UbiE